jgi:hypothetical protein
MNYGSKKFWWNDKDDVGKAIHNTITDLFTKQSIQHTADNVFLRLYSNRAASTSSDLFTALNLNDEIRINVVRSCIDTLSAQIGAKSARPQHLTNGGDYSTRKRNEMLDDILVSAFIKGDVFNKAVNVFRDGGIFGSGFLKVLVEDGQICYERTPSTEILVDEQEGRYGKPRQWFQLRQVPKDSLEGFLKPEEVTNSVSVDWEMQYLNSISEMCTVIEAWKLPLNSSDTGRHVICTTGGVLLDEDWMDMEAPFAKWDWMDAVFGFRGQGIVEELLPIQEEINAIARKVQRNFNLNSVMVMVEEGTNVGTITNRDYAIHTYTGHAPQIIMTPPIDRAYLDRLDRLVAQAYEIIGISVMAAQSEIPAGLESGAAIRAFHGVGSKRFEHVGKRWGQFFVDIGERTIDACARAQRDGEKLHILGKSKMDFKKVLQDRDGYIVRTFPVALLPDEPSGKLSAIQGLLNAAPDLQPFILPLLTGVPDLEYAVKEVTAPRDYIEMAIEAILLHGVYEPPMPYTDVVLARKIATNSVTRAQIDGVDQDRIEMLYRWMAQIDAMAAEAKKAATPEAPAGAPPAPEAPQGAPQADPASMLQAIAKVGQ